MSEKSKKPKEFALTKLSAKFDKSIKSNYVVDSIEKAIYLINDYLADSPNELLMGIALDEKNQPICASVLSMGNEGHVDNNYNNLFSFIFTTSGCKKIILMHNHPSAEKIEPSNVDIKTFEEIKDLVNKVGIGIGDFIIVGNEKQNRAYYSYFENKVITQYEFLKNLKNIKLEKPLEVVDSSDKTLDEVNGLLAESEYNSEKTSSTQKSSNGLFNVFK